MNAVIGCALEMLNVIEEPCQLPAPFPRHYDDRLLRVSVHPFCRERPSLSIEKDRCWLEKVHL